MGAFDSYSVLSRCPRCEAVHHLEGQTKFFNPDFTGIYYRSFELGAMHPLDVRAEDILRSTIWEDEWWRVSEAGSSGEFTLLADLDDNPWCTCGAPLATLLRFRLQPQRPPPEVATSTAARCIVGPPDSFVATVELVEAQVFDIEAQDPSPHVNFAPVYGVAGTSSKDWRAAIEALASAPISSRLATLRVAFAELYRPGKDLSGSPPWTTLYVPVRCEACGDTRDRHLHSLLSHPDYRESFFGPSWSGGLIVPGMRIETTQNVWESDVDRGYMVRISAPPARAKSVVILNRPQPWGCRCGAGRTSIRLSFALEDKAMAFQEATLRVVKDVADFAEVDFAEAPFLTRDVPGGIIRKARPKSLEEVQNAVFEEWFPRNTG